MNEGERIALSKAGLDRDPSDRTGRRGLPPVLLSLAVSRVQIVAMVILATMFFGWFLGNVAEGEFLDEFQRLGEWAPAVFLVVASLGMLAVARWRLLPPGTLVVVALGYQIAVSFGIAWTSYFGAFRNMPAAAMTADVVGFTAVALWMLMFTVIVPNEPRRALVALLASASAVPIVYLLEVQSGRAPAMPTLDFWGVFVGPYAAVALMAYIAARVIYRLGQDVTRARDMGSYRLVAKLGEGGMGEVWRAQHRMLARPAAIKLIHGASLGADANSVAARVARFEREAQATALLQSPHTVEVYDFGTTEDGAFYYVMELLEGIDLEQLVQRFGPLPPSRVIYLLQQVCRSLAEAHQRGLVHRDIKPANIYLCRRALEEDFVKVLDFGLVRQRSGSEIADDLHLSRSGTIHGTPAYLAPEAARGDRDIDGRADLYAVGCVAYWLLTGRRVFEKTNYAAMLLAHANQQPDPPSRYAEEPLPPGLEAVVLRCLAKEPGDRVQSAEELAAELSAVATASPWTIAEAAAWWRAHMATDATSMAGMSAGPR